MKKDVKNVTAADIPNAKYMPIYTKTGDNGSTSIFGGRRVLKSDWQIEACGSIDELSSFIGLVASKLPNKTDVLFLVEIQKDLYKIMSVLSGAKGTLNLLEEETIKIERIIDKIQTQLPELKRFILPIGTELSAWLHIVRTICRRVERSVVKYFTVSKTLEIKEKQILLSYINRLSDLFFALSRFYNQKNEAII